MIVIWILIGAFLIVGSIYDVKSFELPLWLLVAGVCGSFLGAGYLLLREGYSWWELLWSLLPGGISLLLSFVTREQIGYGDGVVLLILGLSLGPEAVFGIWMLGLFASFITSILLLMSRRATRTARLPFVPFLLLGYVLVVVGGAVA